jgi:hypothetical protein
MSGGVLRAMQQERDRFAHEAADLRSQVGQLKAQLSARDRATADLRARADWYCGRTAELEALLAEILTRKEATR